MLQEPTCLDDFERYAAQHLDKNAFDYYSCGAGEDVTLQENRQAFRRLRLRPRMLRKVSNQDTSVTVLGHKLRMPICVSPTACQCVAHPDGEIATARAVLSLGTAMGLSVYSTYSLREVASEAANTVKFSQLQFFKDRELMKELLMQAESLGYKAILLTVDIPVSGRHPKRKHFYLPRHLRYANFLSLKERRGGLNTNKEMADYIKSLSDTEVEWETVDWLRSLTSLPFIFKGILTGEDARLAVQHGAQGILVSNHGGRQLDGVPASIDVLQEIVEAVRGTGVEVYLDGGVRTGTDVLKALALGARAVFIGRPVLWGLAYKGEEGVTEVLRMLHDELKLAMTLAGCASLKDIIPSLIVGYQTSQL